MDTGALLLSVACDSSLSYVLDLLRYPRKDLASAGLFIVTEDRISDLQVLSDAELDGIPHTIPSSSVSPSAWRSEMRCSFVMNSTAEARSFSG